MSSKPEKDEKPEPDAEHNQESKLEPIQKLKRLAGHLKKLERKKAPAQKPEIKIESTKPESIEKAEPQKVERHAKKEKTKPDKVVESLLRPEMDYDVRAGPTNNFEDFVDERKLISHDIFGKKEMKIKVLEVSDEPAPLRWKLGDRIKVNKILVTVKHLETQQVEEAEFDIEEIEKELAKKRHYTSTNRWVPTNDIKNGYVISARHTFLISDAIALEYIAF